VKKTNKDQEEANSASAL